MSDGDYGYCEYCGSYRPLRYSHKYCSKRCYIDSDRKKGIFRPMLIASRFGMEATACAHPLQVSVLKHENSAHGLTLRVKGWSTCAAVPERGEALLRAAEEWSAAARKCGKPDPERSGGERPDI